MTDISDVIHFLNRDHVRACLRKISNIEIRLDDDLLFRLQAWLIYQILFIL